LSVAASLILDTESPSQVNPQMRKKRKLHNYDSLVPSSRQRLRADRTDELRSKLRVLKLASPAVPAVNVSNTQFKSVAQGDITSTGKPSANRLKEQWTQKRGHTISFAGLFVFTFLVYFRPYELFPTLSWLSKSAMVVALITIAAFVPAQLSLENRITAKPLEIKLVFGLLVTGLLSVPLALNPARAFQSFTEYLKVVVMFVVMVNVLRTPRRLTNLILLVLLASCVLSLGALNDYRLGNLALQGRRIAGVIGGLFSNPNDLALHLVTMIPISVGMMLGARSSFKKFLFLGCVVLLIAGMVATFSRGGFLGFICVTAFLVWKFAPRNRIVFGVVALTVVTATIAIAPGYRNRLSDINDASAVARTDDLKRSILVAVRHPVFGVGMDNYIIYSNANKATHNAYTQVAAEMGVIALLIYFAFLITPFRRLRQIEQATWSAKDKPPIYYLAIGLQASLVAYMVISFFASVAYLWYAYYIVAYCICVRRIHAGSSEDLTSAPEPNLSGDLLDNRRPALRPTMVGMYGER
jgi:putative inorganic carbon (hco3(-)) transporter